VAHDSCHDVSYSRSIDKIESLSIVRITGFESCVALQPAKSLQLSTQEVLLTREHQLQQQRIEKHVKLKGNTRASTMSCIKNLHGARLGGFGRLGKLYKELVEEHRLCLCVGDIRVVTEAMRFGSNLKNTV
jgi:hypothetical protein